MLKNQDRRTSISSSHNRVMFMLTPSDLEQMKQAAEQLLDDHWRGDHVKASDELYPHQWGWDAGWFAMGLSTYRPGRAREELLHLMDAQWDNGMVPQIVFDPDFADEYFPGPDRWQSDRIDMAPNHVRTSGIVQPPVQAWAAKKVYDRSPEPEATEFLETIYPKLVDWHEYLYEERDPDEEYLPYIRHPWESGLDNAPDWDPALQNIDLSEVELEPYDRIDLTKDVSPDQRPSDEKYDRYVHLVDSFRKLSYDEEAIYDHTEFFVQEPMFNAILVKSNQMLAELADILDRDSETPRRWAEQTSLALRLKLWNSDRNRFNCWDTVRNHPIDRPSSLSFAPFLGSTVTDSQAHQMYQTLNSVGYCPLDARAEECWSIPTYNMHSEEFIPNNYWRGPVWGYTNRVLSRGLRDMGFGQKAAAIEKDFLALVHRHGFSEYYDPIEGCPLGTSPFPTSAAHVLDLLESYEYSL